MQELAWVAPFREAVLVVFFLFFTGLIAQLYLFDRNGERLREYANQPLEDE